MPPSTTPRPPKRRLPWLLIGGGVIVLVAVVAATAAITYAVTRDSTAAPATPTSPPPSTSVTQPQFSAGDQAAAKKHVCEVFDTATRGSMSQGALRDNGQSNVLAIIRAMNSVAAVQNALTPAAPADVTNAARNFINAELATTTGAASDMPMDDFNRLNSASNDATYAFADVCGLPH